MKIIDSQKQLFNTTTDSSSTINSDAFSLHEVAGYCIVADVTSSIPSAKTFEDGDVDTETEILTVASHGFLTGLKVRLTSTGTLPAGLELATDYFVIASTSGTLKLASSLANALAGTAVDITAAEGTGTHTITPVAGLTGTVLLQASLDGSTWVTISNSSQNVSGATTLMWNTSDAFYKFVRAQGSITVGQGTFSAKITTKSNE